MGPFPRPERQSDKPDSREKPSWPWEKSPTEKVAKDKSDNPKPDTKNKPDPQKEQKPEAKKDEPTEKKTDEEKHERRSTLIEQSIALVAKYEEEPIPRDATTLARLMIAHQVVHLNNQLEQPNNENLLAPEKIEATLDYITKLDAKFKDPNAKVEPDVEQSYQEVMQLAKATLEEEPDLETVVESLNNQSTLRQPDEGRSDVVTLKYLQPDTKATSGPDFSAISGAYLSSGRDQKGEQDYTHQNKVSSDQTKEEFDRRRQAAKETIPAVATAASLVYLITHLGRKKSKQETVSNSGDHSSSSISSPLPQSPPIASSQSRSEQLTTSSYTKRAAPFSGRERVTIPHRPSVLATAVVATAFGASRTSNEAPRIAQSTPNEHAQSSHRETPQPSRREAPQPETTTKTDRKIEHMPLLQLLSMAENVDIGHGHYLRREFESGRINREGLVKILKAHSKGRDYQFEFRQQASRFAVLKAASPEFLHQYPPQKHQDEPTYDQSAQSPNSETSKDEQPTPQQSEKSLQSPANQPLVPAFMPNPPHKPHVQRRLILIILGFLGFLIALGLGAFYLYSLLSN